MSAIFNRFRGLKIATVHPEPATKPSGASQAKGSVAASPTQVDDSVSASTTEHSLSSSFSSIRSLLYRTPSSSPVSSLIGDAPSGLNGRAQSAPAALSLETVEDAHALSVNVTGAPNAFSSAELNAFYELDPSLREQPEQRTRMLNGLYAQMAGADFSHITESEKPKLTYLLRQLEDDVGHSSKALAAQNPALAAFLPPRLNPKQLREFAQLVDNAPGAAQKQNLVQSALDWLVISNYSELDAAGRAQLTQLMTRVASFDDDGKHQVLSNPALYEFLPALIDKASIDILATLDHQNLTPMQAAGLKAMLRDLDKADFATQRNALGLPESPATDTERAMAAAIKKHSLWPYLPILHIDLTAAQIKHTYTMNLVQVVDPSSGKVVHKHDTRELQEKQFMQDLERIQYRIGHPEFLTSAVERAMGDAALQAVDDVCSGDAVWGSWVRQLANQTLGTNFYMPTAQDLAFQIKLGPNETLSYIKMSIFRKDDATVTIKMQALDIDPSTLTLNVLDAKKIAPAEADVESQQALLNVTIDIKRPATDATADVLDWGDSIKVDTVQMRYVLNPSLWYEA